MNLVQVRANYTCDLQKFLRLLGLEDQPLRVPTDEAIRDIEVPVITTGTFSTYYLGSNMFPS